jgi:predicted ArsR family transcriptional regulator
VFTLTEQGDGLFPDQSASFACDLLEQVEQRFGAEALARLLEERTDTTIASLKSEYEGLSFEQRVAALASRFNDLGFATEVVALDDGAMRVIEHNCPTRGVAERFPMVCHEELRLYEEVAGARVSRDCRIIEGGKTCEYRLEPMNGTRSLPILDLRRGGERG